ncbi:Cytochrome c2 [Rickettsiales bacterium Ac37b]|nr:Cytochrome c2 [Rickettsiales bacterium Ac37b]
MSGFELNKIAASILLAGLIAMVVGNIADIIYRPHVSEKRGYTVEVTQSAEENQPAKEEVVIDIPALLAKGDVDRGQKLSKACLMCHNFEKGKGPKIGPDLWGVVGANKLREDYEYSAAMKAKGGSWTYDELFSFLQSPQKFIPGTKMTFAGFKKPQDVADVVTYLRSLSDNPVPLPEETK